MINVDKAIKAQSRFTKINKKPHFAPSDGICGGCKKQIYNKIAVDVAERNLITSCPFCYECYCD